jgi:hypothetical protein
MNPSSPVGIEGFTNYTFTAFVEDPDSDVVNFEWSLPDFDVTGGSLNTATVSGVFRPTIPEPWYPWPPGPWGPPPDPDLRSVALTVRDDRGGVGSWTTDLRVYPGGESVTNFDPAPDIGQTPPVIHINGSDLVMRPSNTAAFLDWVMEKPDGSIVTFDPPGAGGVWRYPVPLTTGSGVYVITQRRTFEEVVDTVYINRVPEAILSYSFTEETTVPTEVTFTDHSVDYNGTVESVVWNFGALGTFSGPSATVQFEEPGVYSYTQTVTDNQGGVKSVNRTITVPLWEDFG